MRLRSVELHVTEAVAASSFLQEVWGLLPAGEQGGTRFFRGSGDHPYILSLRQADAPAVGAIEFAASAEEIGRLEQRVRAAGVPCSSFARLDAPGGGSGLCVQGPEAQAYRFVTDSTVPVMADSVDMPIQITHAVINAVDVAASERFAVDVLGFRVSDRTRAMTFVRCDRKHHAIAYAHAQLASLNHIAFEMRDTDAVMRGFGRMRDAGFSSVWGPGRHGPGNNVFGYFIAPFGAVIEYTAEVSEVGDDYRVGNPQDWTWPPGRSDHWGVSVKDSARVMVAERTFRFGAASGNGVVA
jgi:catechol 2,3-dioxygenase-like lactoylglutathione lyase family enzyme